MKNWMLSIAFLSSSFVSLACAWYPYGEEVRFSLFGSHLAGHNDASPLFYSCHFFNDYKVDEYRGPTENLNEWYDYFHGKYKTEAIDELLYHFDHDTKKNEVAKNPLIVSFVVGNHVNAAEYIMFAKKVEEQLREDHWDKKKMDIEGLHRSIGIAQNKILKLQDAYLQLRYAYQLIVMSYYLGKYDDVQGYYKNYILKSPEKSVIKWWSMFFYALTKEDENKQNYLLAQVFDHSKSKATYIYKKFPSDRLKAAGVLDFCKGNEDKAAVLSLLAFKNPGRAKDQIMEIADLTPNSELLDILLIREINKMEDWYLTEKHTTYETGITSNYFSDREKFDFIKAKNFQSDKKYLRDFRDMVSDILERKKVENRSLWFTSLAYMSYMLDEKEATESYLHHAKKHAETAEIKGQILITEILHTVKYEDKWDEGFQADLMRMFYGLEKFKKDIYDYDRFKSQIMLAITNKYLEMDNFLLASLFQSKVKARVLSEYGWGYEPGYQSFDLLNENATSEDMDEFFAFWNKKDKTPLEEWLMEDIKKYKWRLTDLWATQYFREDKLDKALAIYRTIPDSVWQVDNWELHYYYKQELDNDPFETNIYGRGRGNESGNTYTKPEFVAEIIRLKGLLEGDTKNKDYYAMLLGNAYYNMSYHGNSYYYTEYGWSGYENDDYARDQSYYYTAERAFKYYEMAESLAVNTEFAAFCYRLQLKCVFDEMWYNDSIKNKHAKMSREQEWDVFAGRYPEHYQLLMGCDHFDYYSSAWKRS
ncbi:MAG: hypothetical protein WDZ35_08020 [Crocinitomicaceae bacterium]